MFDLEYKDIWILLKSSIELIIALFEDTQVWTKSSVSMIISGERQQNQLPDSIISYMSVWFKKFSFHSIFRSNFTPQNFTDAIACVSNSVT